jgi:predicted ArsR family transcriptional regulator
MAGRPPDVSDEELLEMLRESSDPALFTGEIAEELPIGRDGVRSRLDELVTDGRLAKKQRGNSIIWWLAETESSSLGDEQA